MQIINEISQNIWEDVLLVAVDVSSLYTIIPHELGYQAARYFLTRDQCLNASTLDFILRLLQFSMEHNYFYYGGEYYLQSTEVAVEAKFVPSLTNLFMALWKNDILFSLNDSGLLFLWKGDEESLY